MILGNKWFLIYIDMTNIPFRYYAMLQNFKCINERSVTLMYTYNYIGYFLFDRLVLLSRYSIVLNDKVLSILYSKSFSYNSFFCNWEYFDLVIYKNSIKLYSFYSILLKKQNSFLKKKVNLLNNFYTISQKSKNFDDLDLNNSYLTTWDNLKYKFFLNYSNKLDLTKVLDLRKKVKKTILENRKLFSNFLLFNSKRSFRINRLALLLGQKKIWHMCSNLELSIISVLVNSKLVYSNSDAKNFLANGFVYVNRQMVSDYSYIVKSGDVVELVFSKLYYMYMLRLKLVNEKVNLKMKNKLWVKLRNKINLTKGNELYLINMYKNNNIYKFYIPSYMEVDYSVLTVIIVANLKSYLDFSFFFRKFLSYFFIRHYGWKWLS